MGPARPGPPGWPPRGDVMIVLTRARAATVAALALAVSLAAAVPGQETLDAQLRTFLRDRLRLTPAQLTAVERGDAVAVDLPSSVDREIAVAGVVRIDAPAERLVALVGDIERFESGPGFLKTGKISDPPVLADFSALEVPAEDVADLRKCRPGKCEVKLGQGAFDQLKSIDWTTPDAHARVTALARQMALDYVVAYRQGGNAELAVYRDNTRPTFIAAEFADMMGRTAQLPETLPGLADYLLEYPKASRPAGLEEFFYWSLAEFGLKPLVRLNHVVIYPLAGTRTRYAIATKQLYASHYFHTALEVRALLDDTARPGHAHYLVVLNVARSDGLTGMFGGIVKSKARSGSRDGLQRALAATKRRCEAG